MGRATRDAQRLHLGKALKHAVEVGHVAEHHALVNGLQKMRAGMQRLHAVKTTGHLQPGVAAVEEWQEEHLAFRFRQAGDGMVDLIE